MPKSFLKTCGALASSALILTVSALPVAGQSTSQPVADSDIGFYVKALLPANQTDRKLSYFDLKMEPHQSQTLEVEVVNRNAAPIEVSVAAVSASTTTGGVLDYRTLDVRDETLKISFEDIAVVREKVVKVPGGGSAKAKVDIQMPGQSYDGVILGGVLLEKIPPERTLPESGAQGPDIRNVYGYAVAAVLRETNAKVGPDFEVVAVTPATVDNQVAAVHCIRNRNAAVVKDMALNAVIYREGSEQPVAKLARDGIDMAPNSVMDLAVFPGEGKLPAGLYTSVLELRHGGRKWEFTLTFELDKNEARILAAEVVRQNVYKIPPWVIALLCVLAAAALVMAVLLARNRRNKAAVYVQEKQTYTKKPDK